MTGSALLTFALLGLGQAPAQELPAGLVWIHGSTTPHRSLQEALASLAPGCGRLRLGAGLHRAGLTLPPGCTLEGPPEAVLEGGDQPFTLQTPQGVRLHGLTIRGGKDGLVAGGETLAEGTRWADSGHSAITLQVGARFRGQGNHFAARVPTPVGITARGAYLVLRVARFEGPFERAVELKGGSLTLHGASFEGAATAVLQVGDTVELTDLSVRGGQGPAVVLAKVEGSVRGLRVEGHEYALLTREVSNLVGEDLYSHAAIRAAFGLVLTRARLRGLYAMRPGPFGGLQLVKGEVEVRDFWIHQATEQAITTHDTTLRLTDGRITDLSTASEGGADGVQIRGGVAHLRRVEVWRASGVGLLVAESGQLHATDVQLVECGLAGAAAETKGVLLAGRLTVLRSGGPALLATEKGRVEVETLFSSGNALGVVTADCPTGAQVNLGQVFASGNASLGGRGCVHRR